MNSDNTGWKIIFIDDEEGIRTIFSIMLEDAGYSVYSASDGESGFRLCEEVSPQLVITDIRMPGMDGIELLRRIKECFPEKEVIVVTAFGDLDTAVKALRLHASDFITKPIQDDALFVALDRAKERYTRRKALHDYTALMEERWMVTAEELARTFNFQNHLIESSIDGIMGCDRDWRIVTFNRSLERMLGYRKEDVLRKMMCAQLFSAGEMERFKENLYSEQFGGKNRLYLYETMVFDKSGNPIPVQLSATVLFEETEEIGLVGFFRDLREIRRLEQQFADQERLLHQDKLISLGRLAASVVHEINNPLAGILNYAKLMIKILGRGSPEPEQLQKFRRYLDLVESETSRCSKIVSNLLAFSRKSEFEFREVAITELLDKCVLLSKHKMDLQKIEVSTNAGGDVPNVWGDFNQIQQCIINLIFNAIDAMPQGGRLTLSGTYNQREKMVEIRIEDTGCGIAKKDIPHVFEPFFTTKKEGKGLGLGLSTVYGIIERHKGNISLESEQGKGTVSIIKLPVRKIQEGNSIVKNGYY